MKNISIIALVCAAVTLYSCKKKKTDEPNSSTVKVSVTSPEEGHIYHNGDTVHILASVTYDGILHGYEVKVVDTASGTILYDFAEHVHQDSFVVNRSFVVSGTAVMRMKLTLEAEVDHAGAAAGQEVHCEYAP